MGYAELHARSNFSFLQGASHPEELVAQACALGYQALALTDECSVAGVVRAWGAARDTELALITGSEFRLDDLSGVLILLVANRRGYAQLCQLITRGRRRCSKGHYQLGYADLALIQPGDCLALWQPDQDDEDSLARLQTHFGTDLYLAARQRLLAEDRRMHDVLIRWSQEHHCAVIATGDVLMHQRQRKPLQDLVTAIRHGCRVQDAGYHLCPNAEQYLRPLQRLRSLFPEPWLAETLRLAERCRFELHELRYEYPSELVPRGHTPASWLRHRVEQGCRERFPQGLSEQLRQQLDKELALIRDLAYEPFFLTIDDIVCFARSQGILCQGRGSAANSVVCYCLGITEVDPRRIDLLLERFISPERNEPPDIDVDFEHQRREEVIQYIYRKYGRHRTALAATVICYRPRSALRDAGKALGLDAVHIDQLLNGIDWRDREDHWQQQIKNKGLLNETGAGRHFLPLVQQLLGVPRHLSQHVGGFVIASDDIANLVPVENAAMAERTVIQWDKDDLEALGLLKVDVLALGMLSAIRRTLGLLQDWHGGRWTLADIPAEDPATYQMLQRGDSMGVFQVESRAQMSMLPRLRPDCFYDLVIEVAIVRPGPIQGNMVHPYLKRRHGQEPVRYASPEIERVLGKTLGVPIFQEQAIRLAMVAAGFSAGEADQLRRAMAAWKKHGDLSIFRDRLLDGMRERGYDPTFAEDLYNQIRGFAGYGFPESHSASFALLVYVSAWLKRHHPAAFLCGLLNSQPMGFYSPSQLVQDARRHGVTVQPVCVQHSQVEHTLAPQPQTDAPAVRLGLRQVRGLSREGAERIVAQRPATGYKTVAHLRALASVATRDLEVLASANALATLTEHRYQARWDILDQHAPLALAPGTDDPEPCDSSRLPAPAEGASVLEDYASTGLTLARHPMTLLRAKGYFHHLPRAEELTRIGHGRPIRVAGLVTGRQRPGSAAGVTFVTLEDETGNINLVVWQATARAQRRALLSARLLEVHGVLERQGDVIHVIAGKLRDCSPLIEALPVPSRDFH